MTSDKFSYNENLDPSEQIQAEEDIAAYLFDNLCGRYNSCPTEEECAQAGRDILMQVLNQFRPDLVDSTLNPIERARMIEELIEDGARVMSESGAAARDLFRFGHKGFCQYDK